MENLMSRVCALRMLDDHSHCHRAVFYIRQEINFMQIILTKSNNIKFEKQIGHLVLFSLFTRLFRSPSICLSVGTDTLLLPSTICRQDRAIRW